MASPEASFLIDCPGIVPVHAQFWDGNELVKLMREYDKAQAKDPFTNYSDAREYRGYVFGVHDGTQFLYSGRENVTVGQVGAIVSKYLKAHPEKWDQRDSDLVIQPHKTPDSCLEV